MDTAICAHILKHVREEYERGKKKNNRHVEIAQNHTERLTPRRSREKKNKTHQGSSVSFERKFPSSEARDEWFEWCFEQNAHIVRPERPIEKINKPRWLKSGAHKSIVPPAAPAQRSANTHRHRTKQHLSPFARIYAGRMSQKSTVAATTHNLILV